MILVTLGTQKFQMNRLIQAVDDIQGDLGEEIFIQTGHSDSKPKNCAFQAFVDKKAFQQMIRECRVLITHSGVGSIMTGIYAGKPVIVVPRLARYKEHVDDHQLQIAEAFAGKGCVLSCTDVSRLKEYVEKAEHFAFQPYQAPEGNIEEIILRFIQS